MQVALKPVTFKIEESELEALEREAKDRGKSRSEYVRDIVTNRPKGRRK